MTSVNRIVLDASALLALVLDEPGAERVERVQDRSAVSAVNVAEVAARLCAHGFDPERLPELVTRLRIDVETLDLRCALVAGGFAALPRARSLSLGDRCCLALAKTLDAPALTADRRWSGIAPALGVEVVQIR